MNSAKEYLNQIKQLQIKIKCIEADIEAIRAEQLTLTSIRLDGMPHGTKISDPTAEKAIKLADTLGSMEEKLIDTKSEYWRKRMEIINTISKVEDADLYELLYLHYVELESFEGIAYKMGYSYRHTIRRHGRALQEVGRLI